MNIALFPGELKFTKSGKKMYIQHNMMRHVNRMLSEYPGGILYPRYKLKRAFLEEIPFESDVLKYSN